MEQDRLRDFLKFVRFQLNWLIVAAGFLVVMVLVGSLYLSRLATAPSPSQTPTTAQLELETPSTGLLTPVIVPEPSPTPKVVLRADYIVQAGDSLWSIAKKQYGSGYFYLQISKANQLPHPDQLAVGQQLILPEISIAQGRIASGVSIDLGDQSAKDTQPPVTSYQVKSGDCLWAIAEQQLGDPYRWVELYQLNQAAIGSNPDMIYPNTQLQLPSADQPTSRLPSDSLLQ
ncbi:MAG: hypothetical protein COY81_02890 [Candidatus Pacebacteria bacterium CG_4_10_14_0_8_um_filter_43_12]|nr:MAG: hypothetical protein COY81_02890 [Candidatus Pacebacteria bacterium CG_4_10_14_0_8_um_filter_43_12]